MKDSQHLANLITAITPGGIEAQEKQGQIEQSFKDTLPIDLGKHRADFEALGFVFGPPEPDGLFMAAQFPSGWRKKPTDHSMWTRIVDEHGHERGSIFYKAAIYDQRATAHLHRRFQVAHDHAESEKTVRIHDARGLVNHQITGLKKPDWNGDRAQAEALQDKIDAAEREMERWIEEHYPDHRSVTAYWKD